MSDDERLPERAQITWLLSREGARVHEVTIMANGWLRVTWLDGATSHVSPAAVKAVHGKGVSYGD